MQDTVFRGEHIYKQYPGVKALDDVSFELKKGEVHALLGENGAGKSTLIKTVSGAIIPDEGTLVFGEKSFKEMSPQLASKLGVAVIYQEFNLFPTLSVAENVFLSTDSSDGFFISFKEKERKTKEIFDMLGARIDPRCKVSELSTADKQQVEIAKALSKNANILVMDEPTAPLAINEVEALFSAIHKLKERGVAIIYISHRLNEVFRVADRVTIMRDGKVVGTNDTKDLDKNKIISMMVGRDVSEEYPGQTTAHGEVLLECKGLYGNGLNNISFKVRAGEILGVGGLVGVGRTETMRMVFGADPLEAGEIHVNGKEVKIKSPADAVRQGIGLVPEDRKLQGVLLRQTIRENITLASLKRLARLSFINREKERNVVNAQKDSLNIKAPSINQTVGNLSGGNQQKVALAKWLARECNVLIMDEPTRGIDVGAKMEIYILMRKLCEEGKAIIMISSDMEELLGMSDRIMVLSEDGLAGTLEKEEFSQEKVLLLASGNR